MVATMLAGAERLDTLGEIIDRLRLLGGALNQYEGVYDEFIYGARPPTSDQGGVASNDRFNEACTMINDYTNRVERMTNRLSERI